MEKDEEVKTMEWRKMRRKDKAMSTEEIECFLSQNCVGHLATINTNGYPYVIPMNYFYDKGKIILHSALAGEKLDNIKANPKVCFEVAVYSEVVKSEKPCDYTIYYHSVVAFGKAVIVEGEEKNSLLNRFIEGFTADKSVKVGEKESKNVAVILIEIESVTGKKN
jgi:hypothetical protein